jgi:hypothetical protein
VHTPNILTREISYVKRACHSFTLPSDYHLKFTTKDVSSLGFLCKLVKSEHMEKGVGGVFCHMFLKIPASLDVKLDVNKF